ncbi:MAG: HAMP domain-containing histidine kinase [Actinomycetia bacterium]|nr:HAMP domain-containing histidine kinase [Actinomycetes bacterium]
MRSPLARLGPRLFASYLVASAAATASGLVAVWLAPTVVSRAAVATVLAPPEAATEAQRARALADLLTQAVLGHVALSLAVAVVMAVLLTAYVSRQLGAVLGGLAEAARMMAQGRYDTHVETVGVAELDAVAREVNRLAVSLEEARAARDLAIASLSHELRTPLTALRAYCEGAREGVVPLSGEILDRMGQSIRRLERMAEDLDALRRAEGAAPPLQPVRVEVHAAVAEALAVHRPAFERAGVGLIAPASDGDRPVVRADPVRLAQVLDNLLQNSLQHTPPGRTVRLDVRGEPGYVVIAVRDEGQGILPEDLPHVTEPFYRGKASGGRSPRPGMGLGLTIARRWAEAMGGRLVLASGGPGHGTTAELWLRAEPEALSDS